MDITEVEYDKLFDVNVKAAFMLTKLAVPIIKQSGLVLNAIQLIFDVFTAEVP